MYVYMYRGQRRTLDILIYWSLPYSKISFETVYHTELGWRSSSFRDPAVSTHHRTGVTDTDTQNRHTLKHTNSFFHGS